MYYPFFLTYILTGLVIGALLFLWALKNGQFSDQQRARFLALEEENRSLIKDNKKGKFELYAVFFLVLAGIASSFMIIAYALFSRL